MPQLKFKYLDKVEVDDRDDKGFYHGQRGTVVSYYQGEIPRSESSPRRNTIYYTVKFDRGLSDSYDTGTFKAYQLKKIDQPRHLAFPDNTITLPEGVTNGIWSINGNITSNLITSQSTLSAIPNDIPMEGDSDANIEHGN